MNDLDSTTVLQLIGMAATFFAALAGGGWAIYRSRGTDRDTLLLFGMVGGGVLLTLIQFIVLIVRLS